MSMTKSLLICLAFVFGGLVAIDNKHRNTIESLESDLKTIQAKYVEDLRGYRTCMIERDMLELWAAVRARQAKEK
jgi:hypothetical protein